MEKNEKKDLITRRDFFKKAGKKTLPMIGAVVALSAIPQIGKSHESKVEQGCYYGCTGSCSGTCSGGCMGCSGTCTGGCDGSCERGCSYTCTGSCNIYCSGSCKGSCTRGNYLN